MSNARIPCLIRVEGSETAAPGGVGVSTGGLVGTCRSAIVVLLELAEPALDTAGGRRGVVGVGKRVRRLGPERDVRGDGWWWELKIRC